MKNIDAIYVHYKELRKKGFSAKRAARAAIHPAIKTPVNWKDGTAQHKIGPYDVEIKIKDDPDPDISYMGTYSVTPDTNAIIRHHAATTECRYWNPTISLDEDFQNLHQLGYSKADAWIKALEYREQAYNRCERFCRGFWTMVGIVATAKFGNMVCGESSLWGIESDSQDYIDEIALDMATEAAAEADENRDKMICTRAKEITALASIPHYACKKA